MFKLVAKILIFVCSFLFFFVGILSFVYYFSYYMGIFDDVETACAIVQAITMMGGGTYGIFAIRKKLPTRPLFILSGLALALGCYYLYRIYGNIGTQAQVYYGIFGYVNCITSLTLALACYWNRK